MGPNKIEKQFREKLNSREIQPSAQAWDRLDAMLSVTEEKKTKRPFGFLFIAASILVLLTVGMFLFTQKSTNSEPQNNVVGTEIKKDTVQNSIKNNPIPKIKSDLQTEAIATSDLQQKTENNPPITKKSMSNQKPTNNQNLIIKDKVIEYQNPTDVALKDMPKIEKRKEISIENQKEINVKSDEVLMADLENIANASTNKKSVVKVDAKSLLSQVDGELDQTFREKVITKISKNYKSVKVALANRNQE